MDIQFLKANLTSTPAFVIDEDEVINSLQSLRSLGEQSNCKVLYSIKSLPLPALLDLALNFVDGFSVSSLFEARLAHGIACGNASLHLTTPGIRPHEIAELSQLCSHISCNSLTQYQKLLTGNVGAASLGLRVNPNLSFADDVRYDPCRQFTKLGVALNALSGFKGLKDVKGLHFHTVFNAHDYTPLIKSFSQIYAQAGNYFAQLEWLNFGGGYCYGQIDDNRAFVALTRQLKSRYGLDIFIEPGYAIVNKAGYLVASVLDVFHSDGKTVAILDTSINHLPEVFEYQRPPQLHEQDMKGNHLVILAGSTCLAGDLFGEYCFRQPISVGDRIVFTDVGAYSIVKANRFNGYNLPDIYCMNHNIIRPLKCHSYGEYRNLWQDATLP